MNISLSQGSAEEEAEGESLCSVLDKNVARLRGAQLDSQFQLDSYSFRLRARARNTIYRVSGKFDWFLKLPPSNNMRILAHEELGADTIRRTLGASPSYCGASIIKVRPASGYVLTSAIRGSALNRVLFTRSWLPVQSARRSLQSSFFTLGVLLGQLHARTRVAPGTIAATTRPFERLHHLLRNADPSDEITRAIVLWNEVRHRSDTGSSFVHGNFRLDNVIKAGERLGFLDFENCGTGSPYQDLSRPVSELLLTRCVVAFPRRRTTACIDRFLAGYRTAHPYEPDPLWDFICVRLARFYLETRAKRLFETRVGGLPVLRNKLNRLMLALMTRDFEDVVPEINC
jgi:Ser/Thr protein kinase RdoA (MazF antagonist)